jgi:hypothetical protein
MIVLQCPDGSFRFDVGFHRINLCGINAIDTNSIPSECAAPVVAKARLVDLFFDSDNEHGTNAILIFEPASWIPLLLCGFLSSFLESHLHASFG